MTQQPDDLHKQIREHFSNMYADSLVTVNNATYWLETGTKNLHIVTNNHALLDEFNGQQDTFAEHPHKTIPKTPHNAAALRNALTYLQPKPLGLSTSAGFGDRLGIATPGHASALKATLQTGTRNVMPIFAQQSIREMTRTNRTAQNVMDDATWGTFESGWQQGVGADADHLKTTTDIDNCVAAGFSFFTIDPGDHVDDEAEHANTSTLQQKVTQLPWNDLDSSLNDFKQRYASNQTQLETTRLEFTQEDVLRAIAKYGQALAHVKRMYQHLLNTHHAFELEVSVDETSFPTKAIEHVVIAQELKRLGVTFVSLAPRYVGSFEKGIDYIGDVEELRKDLAVHAEIARVFGPYKLSLHSGSDKFSVYPLIVDATRGLVHLKTAGTSYLEALRVIANADAALFKQILDLGHERFEKDRKTYHLSCDLANVPTSKQVSDAQLPDLLNQTDARQVLHVTFGSALDAFKSDIMQVLANKENAHYHDLHTHFVKHLEPFTGSQQ